MGRLIKVPPNEKLTSLSFLSFCDFSYFKPPLDIFFLTSLCEEERLNPETKTVLEEAVGFTSLDSTVSGMSHFGLSSHSLESQEHELSKKRDKKII